jgi:glycerophosphoryl diester phosphodiesterase
MLRLSHRGDREQAHENTHDAFEGALKRGVDGLETDIRLTADGVLVLFHNRVAPNGRLVAEMTHQELCDAAGFGVPTADSALAMWDTFWNLELKVPEALDQTVVLVNQYATRRRLLMTSFWHNVIAEAAGRVDVQCGVLMSNRIWEPDQYLARLSALGIGAVVWDVEWIDGSSVEATAANGLACYGYGLTTRSEHHLCKRLGFDGVITDHIAWADAS